MEGWLNSTGLNNNIHNNIANHKFTPQLLTVIGSPWQNVFFQVVNTDWKAWLWWRFSKRRLLTSTKAMLSNPCLLMRPFSGYLVFSSTCNISDVITEYKILSCSTEERTAVDMEPMDNVLEPGHARKTKRWVKNTRWSTREEEELYKGVQRHGLHDWAAVSATDGLRRRKTNRDVRNKWQSLTILEHVQTLLKKLTFPVALIQSSACTLCKPCMARSGSGRIWKSEIRYIPIK